MYNNFKIIDNKIIFKTKGRLCETAEEIINSKLFIHITKMFIEYLVDRRSILLNIFDNTDIKDEDINVLIKTILQLTKNESSIVPNIIPESVQFFKNPQLLNDFIEHLYNYWRGFERYVVCESEGDALDKRPYRTFNQTVGKLTELVRITYRDIEENITGSHPRIYRQVEAGAEFGAISVPVDIPLPGGSYEKIKDISILRQILLNPPLILEPPMNKRTGKFLKIDTNPLDVVDLNTDEWLCYPTKVGELIIHVYFHDKFSELAFSLCNLFDLADDEDLKRKPDAVYLFGVPGDSLDSLGEYSTVFFEDSENDIFVGACPNRDEFGYFGYLKKMVLTLHNAKMIRKKRMPFHGALVHLYLQNGSEATVLFIGDSGAGKSETLEALRTIGDEQIRDLIIIADDMGSLQVKDDGVYGYGTEIGAFLRIDDLKPGYEFGQIDRSIIMSASKTNARIIIPVTSFDNLVKGYKIDYTLYANNYDEIDNNHPVVERIPTAEKAVSIFSEGTVMSKGTTTTTGLVHSYFANVFGPPEYRKEHDELAEKFFGAMYEKGVFVGQMRTRLGIPGWEHDGPEEAAKGLLELICSRDGDGSCRGK